MLRYLAGAALAVLVSGSAFAQDAGPSVYDWTGFYIGGNGGYGWGIDDDVDVSYFGPLLGACAIAPPGTCPTSVSLNSEGLLVGGHAGANWQSGHLVLGVEGDADYTDIDGSGTLTIGGLVSGPVRSELNWLSTLRGRVGFAADRLLIYGTGGLAFGEVESETTLFGPPPIVAVGPPPVFSDSDDGTEFGWAAGAGGEVAVSDHLVFGAEALVVDLDDTSNLVDLGGGDAVRTEFDNAYVIARGRASFKW